MTGDRPPPLARALGFAGLLPQTAAVAALALGAEGRFTIGVLGVTYAALIFSFLGGAWWGLAARAENPPAWTWGLAVAPTLLALAAIGTVLSFRIPLSQVGVALIGAAILLSPLVDRAFVRAGLAPAWWMRLRLPLSIGLGLLTLALLFAA